MANSRDPEFQATGGTSGMVLRVGRGTQFKLLEGDI